MLHGVSLVVGAEPLALLGRNGMGKTTRCQAVLGLVPISSGDIRFDGVSLMGRKPHKIAKLGIGYVPQGRRCLPSLSVEEHLRLMERKRPAPAEWTARRVYEMFPRWRSANATAQRHSAAANSRCWRLFVEQKLAVAAAAAQRLAIMLTGRIALETTSDSLPADEGAQRRYLGVGATANAEPA